MWESITESIEYGGNGEGAGAETGIDITRSIAASDVETDGVWSLLGDGLI